MNILEQAEQCAERIKEQRALQAERDRLESIRQGEIRAGLNEQIEATLNAFDGKHGIAREGNHLMKRGAVIATMETQWETWNNPNCDYAEKESGYVIRWEVREQYTHRTKMRGCGLESFAAQIAEHLID